MKLYSVVFLFLFSTCSVLFGQDIPEPMKPYRLVNDFAGIYNDGEKNDLEQMLRNYNDTTSTQIYVVTISDLGGYAISDYATLLGEKWKVGRQGKDNGAVILIKPKTGNSRGQVFIATGYGLEPILTDARCGRIIDNQMIPYFAENNYYGGTKTAVETIINYLSGEFDADKEDPIDSDEAIKWIITIIVFIAIIIYANKKGNKGDSSGSEGGGGSIPPFFPMGGGGRSSSSGSGRSFGGGGGGRFGGGGAGRGW